MNFLSNDSLIGRFLGKIGDIVVINLLWIICSIPLITLGASTTALYFSSLKIIKDNDNSARKNFFKSFKENFKQSTIIWIIFFIIGIIIISDYWLFSNLSDKLGNLAVIGKYIFSAIGIIWFIIILYLFPVIAAFENTTKNLLKNAIIFSISHLPSTLIMMIITIFPVMLTITDYQLFPLYIFCWFFFGIGLIAYINSTIMMRIFKNYLPPEKDFSDDETWTLK